MAVVFQQQLKEKPIGGRCLRWGWDDCLFILSDRHFQQWRLIPALQSLWSSEFVHELSKSSGAKDVNRTFGEFLLLKMPQLYADVRALSRMGDFVHCNVRDPATVYQLNRLALDPVFIHASLFANNGEVVDDPYLFLRTAKCSKFRYVSVQTQQGNVCIYCRWGSDWKLRQNLCVELMTFASDRGSAAADQTEASQEVNLDRDIKDVCEELNFLRCAAHDWIAEPDRSGMSSSLWSLQRNGQIVVWRAQVTSGQLQLSQVITLIHSHRGNATSLSCRFPEGTTAGFLVVGFDSGMVDGYTVTMENGVITLSSAVSLYPEADNLCCSNTEIFAFGDKLAVVCAKNLHLVSCLVWYDAKKHAYEVSTKYTALISGLKSRILEVKVRENQLFAVDDTGYNVFRMELDWDKKRATLLPLGKDLAPNFSPDQGNLKLCGFAISPNSLVAVTFTKVGRLSLRRDIAMSLQFRANLTDSTDFWTLKPPSRHRLCQISDYLIVKRFLLFTEQRSLARSALDHLIGAGKGSTSLAALPTDQLKLVRLTCGMIGQIRSSRDSDFERCRISQRKLCDRLLAVRQICSMLSDVELKSELESVVEFEETHLATLACVAQFLRWYQVLETDEKVPTVSEWTELLAASGKETEIRQFLSCPVCQEAEDLGGKSFCLPTFLCVKRHTVPRCSTTFLPVGLDGVKCPSCGSFSLPPDCFVGTLSKFRDCSVCGADDQQQLTVV